MTNIEKVIRSIIKKSGGSPDKFKMGDFMERFSHCFAFAPLNHWLGVTIMKNPLDLTVLQQIIFDKKPDTIIECGTAYGGSAYFMACMMDLMNIDNGRVITIDHKSGQTKMYHRKDFVKVNRKIISIDVQELKKLDHSRIEFICSDCLSVNLPELGQKTMVILDCHHSASHVYKELEKYSKLVTIGQYIIVEDTDHRSAEGKGPAAAVKKFIKNNKNFIIDKNREKFGISSNLGGYLLRIF